jgi:hypothetical protein
MLSGVVPNSACVKVQERKVHTYMLCWLLIWKVDSKERLIINLHVSSLFIDSYYHFTMIPFC